MNKRVNYKVNADNSCRDGTVIVPNNATDEEIRLAILDDLYAVDYEVEKNPELLKLLTQATVYCFAVKLEYLDVYKAEKGNDYTVNLKVLAESSSKARKILEEWLNHPEQTGWKYKKWLGITPIPSDLVILEEVDGAVARDKLVDALNKSLQSQFEYVPLYKVCKVAEDLLESGLVKGN